MRLKSGSTSPDFETTDIYNSKISLKNLQGNKVLLSFRRHASCPFCDLRIHQLEKESEYFNENNIRIISVYESDKRTLIKYAGDNNFYTTIVSDPELELYGLYGLESSLVKVISGLFKTGIIRLYRMLKNTHSKDLDHEKEKFRIPGDFLIDENGKIVKTHYHRFLGDEIKLNEIKEIFT